jgi:hypothetical protein
MCAEWEETRLFVSVRRRVLIAIGLAAVLGEQADRQRADPAGRSDGDGEHHPLSG